MSVRLWYLNYINQLEYVVKYILNFVSFLSPFSPIIFHLSHYTFLFTLSFPFLLIPCVGLNVYISLRAISTFISYLRLVFHFILPTKSSSSCQASLSFPTSSSSPFQLDVSTLIFLYRYHHHRYPFYSLVNIVTITKFN